MNKIYSFLFCLLICFSLCLTAKTQDDRISIIELKIKYEKDKDGLLFEKSIEKKYLNFAGQEIIEEDAFRYYDAGQKIQIELVAEGIDEAHADIFFEVKTSHEKTKEVPIEIRTQISETFDGASKPTKVPAVIHKTFDIGLNEKGSKFVVKLFRYMNLMDKLSSKGIVVLEEEFITYRTYYLGLNAGVFFPLINPTSLSYSLVFDDLVNVSRPILQQSKYYSPKAILFLSYYLGGFQPEKRSNSLHFNIGTELSKSILDKGYAGFGFDFKYASIDFFVSYGREEVLPEALETCISTRISNTNVSAVPLIKRGVWRGGIAIAFPLNFAASILGKMIGL